MGANTKTTLTKVSNMIFAMLILLAFSPTLMAQSADLTIGSMMVDESLVTVKNNKLVFNGLSKDQVDNGFSIIGITGRASQGQVKVLGDSQLEYDPSFNICDKSDMFSYLISNGSVESIKEVSVEILCETLAIMSSMSPNGDGEQDSFVILGIDNYPKNELVIFNDLGLEIFKRKNYANDWDGTYRGKILPQGVYYYVFNPGDDKIISGYLYMGNPS